MPFRRFQLAAVDVDLPPDLMNQCGVVMLIAPKGIWGYIAGRFGWSLFPVGYRITWKE